MFLRELRTVEIFICDTWWLTGGTSQTSLQTSSSKNACSQRRDRAAPIFLRGMQHRCMCLTFSVPGTSLADKTPSHYGKQTLLHSSLQRSLLLAQGRFWRAHLLCFIISPMEKQTSLCFSSERCFTSGPTSSFRRSICSRVCWTKYPTAPCWDGSKAWMCCKMSRTFSKQNKIDRFRTSLYSSQTQTDTLPVLAGSKCPGLEVCHTSFPRRTENLCSNYTVPRSWHLLIL